MLGRVARYFLDRRFDSSRQEDRKSTRLNSSHANISYAVFCLKKKKSCSLSIRPTLLRSVFTLLSHRSCIPATPTSSTSTTCSSLCSRSFLSSYTPTYAFHSLH